MNRCTKLSQNTIHLDTINILWKKQGNFYDVKNHRLRLSCRNVLKRCIVNIINNINNSESLIFSGKWLYCHQYQTSFPKSGDVLLKVYSEHRLFIVTYI